MLNRVFGFRPAQFGTRRFGPGPRTRFNRKLYPEAGENLHRVPQLGVAVTGAGDSSFNAFGGFNGRFRNDWSWAAGGRLGYVALPGLLTLRERWLDRGESNSD